MMDSRCYALMIMAVSYGQRGTERAALLGIQWLPSCSFSFFTFLLLTKRMEFLGHNHQSLIMLFEQANSPCYKDLHPLVHVLLVFLGPVGVGESLSACVFCRVTVHIDDPKTVASLGPSGVYGGSG